MREPALQDLAESMSGKKRGSERFLSPLAKKALERHIHVGGESDAVTECTRPMP